MWEKEWLAVKRVKVCKHTFTAKRQCHDALPPFIILYLVILRGKTKALPPLFLSLLSPWGEDKNVAPPAPFLAFPLGGRGTALRWMRGFYLLFCEKGKTVFRIRFPFLTLFPFPKTPHNPRKVIPCNLFQSPLIFKGQRSLVAERI